MKSAIENTPPLQRLAKRNLAILSMCQALLLTIGATAVALNGLAGYALAANKALATLPVTAWIVGGAMAVFPASLLMKRLGRRGGFAVGTLIGFAGVTVCIAALAAGEFWLLCLGAMIAGGFNGFGQLYRFAAADAVPRQHREKAISLVLAGGVIGGLVGPQISDLTVDLLPVRYMGAYVTIYGFLMLTLAALRFLTIPPPSHEELHGDARPLAVIVTQPRFMIGVLCAAMGYGVMNLLMTATPLAMAICGHSFPQTTSVIGWHIVGMFAPSFVTGSLIKRFGLAQVLLAGVLLLFCCLGVALSGISVAHFWWTNVLVGVGWNFLYIGGTALITQTYQPAEKAKAQGANDAAVFLTLVASSLSSGYLLDANGWHLLTYFAIPLVVIAGGAVMALMIQQRRVAPVQAA